MSCPDSNEGCMMIKIPENPKRIAKRAPHGIGKCLIRERMMKFAARKSEVV